MKSLDYMRNCILRFFGEKPKDPKRVDPDAPYHDLRLGDVIDDPSWFTKFENWMAKRGIKGPTKNRYRSAVSRIYRFEMLPENRKASGIAFNPFRGILRDPEDIRDVTIAGQHVYELVRATSPRTRGRTEDTERVTVRPALSRGPTSNS